MKRKNILFLILVMVFFLNGYLFAIAGIAEKLYKTGTDSRNLKDYKKAPGETFMPKHEPLTN